MLRGRWLRHWKRGIFLSHRVIAVVCIVVSPIIYGGSMGGMLNDMGKLLAFTLFRKEMVAPEVYIEPVNTLSSHGRNG